MKAINSFRVYFWTQIILMLHKHSFIIAPETFALVQKLQAIPELEGFYLVGGTALALQIGHRNSIDIDLFTKKEFFSEDVYTILKDHFSVEIIFSKKSTLLTTVDNIKTDFVRHDYPLIKQPITEEGITFLGKEDIAAMKLHAITQSGKRVKDFIDMYFLLEHFSMSEMLGFFEKKYPHTNPLIAFRAVNYFEDIDHTKDLPKMVKSITVESVKERIKKASFNTKKTF